MRVLDVCAGTGGFLIAALNRMFDNIDQLDVNKKTKDKKKKIVTESCLYGVEKEPPIFTLAYANMKFHGDGKSNLFSCSSLLKDKASIEGESLMERMEEIKPQIGMINPPYSLKSDKKKVKDDEDSKIQGKKELDFVISMLEYLQKGGIGIAIVPISCASSSQEKKLRQEILKKHTLLSVMTMPPKLFHDAKVDTQTCIMVFKAKVAHNFNNKVLLARWNDDGFRIIRHNGRIDADDKWSDIKEYWLSMLRNEAAEDSTVWLKRKISNNDEWCVEAYIETDYSKITEVDFEKQLKKYALFQYMQENCLVGDMND
jgi:type I restriction-modification system DNA methylase subunit